MKVNLYNQTAEIIGETELPEKIFGLKLNFDLIHQAVTAQLANSRQTLAHTKGRGEVRGGGRKPWRQKGTGRARHASIRSPIWKGGGVAFGPTKERNFRKKINKKMKRRALFMVLSAKIKDNELMLINDIKLENAKTKAGLNVLKNLSAKMPDYRSDKKKSDSILLVLPKKDIGVERAVRNLSFATVSAANNLNIKELLEKKYLILLKDAIPVIERTYKV